MAALPEIRTEHDLDRFTAANARAIVFYGSQQCGHCRNMIQFINKENLISEYPLVKWSHCETSQVKVENLEGVPTFIGYRNNQAVQRVVGADENGLIDMLLALS